VAEKPSSDDTLAEAHTALARVAQQEWDWAGAEREYRRAIELNPSYPLHAFGYALYLDGMQRFEEAVAQAERASNWTGVGPHQHWAGAAYSTPAAEEQWHPGKSAGTGSGLFGREHSTR